MAPAEVLPDERALRLGRRERAFAQMAAHDLDVLVLGRQANVRYVAGAPQLWVAGTRPFGPTCVVVRATGAIHLLSTWDEGVPDDIPHENLYGIAWNPMNTISVLKRIEGASTAKRVGTDALSPTFAQLLPMAFPKAELVDGELAMRAARRVKTPEEVDALRAAIRVAETGLAAAVSELRPGVSENTLAGVLLESMAAGGVSTPSTQDVAWVTSPEHPWRRGSDDRRVRPGDLVAFSAGVLAGGYTGEVGRTWPVGQPRSIEATADLYRRWETLWCRLIDACSPGAPATDLLAAYQVAGEPSPPMPVARGLGMGFDPPVVSPHLPATAGEERLEPGMVLAVTGYVWERGVGAVFGRDAVLITADGAEVLTTSPSAHRTVGATNG
ncbi:M24 family metallopeptidase [Mycobacterium xenopi]|uniref:Peptidase M24 n=1 Tax=Mycobacterium xenopi TaxID=1789 RepID=A0AAD1GY30_MYCXE|nr:M24 family metallopeptidase [Mycobacterium xenopi]EID09919.1 aminopeptidase [Mycobacterium xenopi RIVM700367]MDA3640509.1 M24 family metallopeptidase [Mycobacterium xenopi]MDA3657957.1 M24 family metallopeptidase [Mycobacterium xenopi]MDA3662661.1 M24 family metallopeptidase [Mycobacterium xenopi]ORX21024.1 Xaa-Pro aminopeptidase [Mycobacterium xenopi]